MGSLKRLSTTLPKGHPPGTPPTLRLCDRAGPRIHRYKDLSGPLVHYGGKCVLRFSPKEWQYLLETAGGLKPIDGVTGTLRIVDKSEALLGWACKTDFANLLALLQEYRRSDGFVEALYSDVETIVAEAKRAHKEHLEDAGIVGKSAHSFVESLAKTLKNERVRLRTLCKIVKQL